MKISDYSIHVVATPWRNLTYLILELADGTIGVGEARVYAKTHTVVEYVRNHDRHFLGHDVFDVEDLYQRILLHDFSAPGEVMMTGLALVEMACWDAIGKIAKQPVYRLLGGKVRDKIPAYANGWYTVERTPEEFANAARRVVARGYKAMKFDPFGSGNLELTRPEFFKSIELIEAVHGAVPRDVQLLIEMHGRFAPHQAIEIAKAIEKLNPAWIEEPCRPDDLGAMIKVSQHTPIPIATGERLSCGQDFRDLFHLRCVDVIQPDINHCGGILEAKKIASTAETYNVMVAPHNVGGIISTTAALHLMATLRNGKILEHFNDFADAFVKEAGTPYPEVVDGFFELPKGPGWGVEIDMSFLRRHAAKKVGGVYQDPGLKLFHNEKWHLREQGKLKKGRDRTRRA